MSDYTELRARLKHDCMCDSETMYQCDSCTASYAIESQAREIAELLARVTAAEDALAADPIMTDKNLVSAVITAVMSGKQSERDDACRKLQRHILAVERERDARETECEQAWDQCHLAERLTHELRVEADALRAKLAESTVALHLAYDAMRAPIDDWKGVLERKAMDAYHAAIAAGGDDAKD